MKKLSEEQNYRLKVLLKKYLSVFVIGVGYYLFIKLTRIRIPCVFNLITKKYCPGCGVTRMFMALAELDFATAVRCNLFVLCLLPFLGCLLAYNAILYIKNGEMNTSKMEKIFYVVALVFGVVFCVLRNTEWATFLVP